MYADIMAGKTLADGVAPTPSSSKESGANFIFRPDAFQHCEYEMTGNWGPIPSFSDVKAVCDYTNCTTHA
jgi:hypothetical protein